MRSFSKKLAFVLAAAMVVTAFAPAAKAEAAKEMEINAKGKILYVTDGEGINDAAQVGGGKGNVAEYDFYVKNKPDNWKKDYSFEWKSSNDKIITVGKGGLTTAVAVGEADVICVVTEKATGTKTTLTNTVTVKANAAEVEITNAEEWDGETVEAGTVVNLDRKMTDAAGNETTKRGEFVTDKTMWVAEPATGVKITQKNGTFEFTEEALAQDYTLYCYTYQSDKYKDATATSEKIVVTYVAGNEFDTKQNSITELTVTFDSTVKALSKEDVTVERVRVRNGKDYFSKMTVKNVALAKDGLSAKVTLFNGMEDKNDYKVTIKNFNESDTFTASVGYPVSLAVVPKVDNKEVLILTTNVKAVLDCKFYDANDVDVTAKGYKATYSLVEYSKNGGYTLSNGNGVTELTIKKSSEVPGVKAKCQKYEGGKLVVDINETFYFAAEDPKPIYAIGVADFSVNNFANYGNQQTLQVQNKSTNKLTVKVIYDNDKTSENGVAAGATLETSVGAPQTLSFTALNPEICNITSDGTLIPYKEGFAGFYVNTVTQQKNGAPLVEPFGEVFVEIKKDSEFSHITLDKYNVTVGVVDKYDSETIKVTAFDQYGGKFDGAKAITVEGVSDNAKAIVSNLIKGGSGKEQTITIDGSTLLAALNATNDFKVSAGDAAYLEFKVKIDGSEQFFSVVVQDKGDAENNYVAIENNNATEALRVANGNGDDLAKNKAAKTLTFSVYQMNNNTKVGTQVFAAYPDKLDNVSAGQYYYKLTKDGNKIDADYVDDTTGTSVSIKLSGLSDAVSGSVIGAGKTVNYDKTGAGNYVFELYYSYADKDLTQIDVNTCYVGVGDKGSYALVAQEKNEVDVDDNLDHSIADGYVATSKKAIVECFKFTGRDNKEFKFSDTTVYDVKYDAVKATGTVFVESITVYEAVAANEYVAYEIPVNVVLVRK